MMARVEFAKLLDLVTRDSYDSTSRLNGGPSRNIIANGLMGSSPSDLTRHSWAVGESHDMESRSVDDTIGFIRTHLEQHGCIVLGVDIDNLHHFTTLCILLENGLTVRADSYTTFRNTSIDRFNFQTFADLLTEPTVDKWNQFWSCQEDGVQLSLSYKEIYVEIIFNLN